MRLDMWRDSILDNDIRSALQSTAMRAIPIIRRRCIILGATLSRRNAEASNIGTPRMSFTHPGTRPHRIHRVADLMASSIAIQGGHREERTSTTWEITGVDWQNLRAQGDSAHQHYTSPLVVIDW